MTTEPGSGALETVILRNGPLSVTSFVHGSSVMRTALGACNRDDTLTLAPLRGAMPIVWSADGLSTIEDPCVAEFVEVPIGIYQQTTPSGIREESPKAPDKLKIIRSKVMEVVNIQHRDIEETRLAIIDEVQRGGTLGTAAKAARNIIDRVGFRPVLRVFAAQDSRRKVSAQPKTETYEALASNSTPNTYTTVVPMPLIATDKTPLLDTVTLEPFDAFTENIVDHLVTNRNRSSERVFRTFGSLARDAELRHDPDFIRSFIDTEPFITVWASNRVESWMATAVAVFDEQSSRRR